MESHKYFKPNSVTWWVGIAQIAAGLALAVFGNVDTLFTLHAVLNDMVGGGSPYAFIMAGMDLIGLRSAVA